MRKYAPILTFKSIKWICSCLVYPLVIISISTKGQIPRAPIRFEDDITLSTLLSKAKAGNKSTMVYLTAKWCGPCRQLQKDIFPDDSIAQFVNRHFVSVMWDIDSVPEGKRLQKQFHVGVPTLLFWDTAGNFQYRFTGYGNKKGFIRGMGYALSPQSDPVFQLKEAYLKEKGHSVPFLKMFVWKMQEANERALADTAFAELWTKTGEQERTSDSMALYTLKYASTLQPLYYNYVNTHREAYTKAVSLSKLTDYICGPVCYKMDIILDKKSDTTNFRKLYRQYVGLLKSLNADSAQYRQAEIGYNLGFRVIYDKPDMLQRLTTPIEKAITNKDSVGLSAYLTAIQLWYHNPNYAALKRLRPQIIKWFTAAVEIQDTYFYDYFLASLYYDMGDKALSTAYLKQAKLAAERQYPGKQIPSYLQLLDKIEKLN